MPSLVQLLRSQDLGHLHAVVELWGIDLAPPDLDAGADEVAAAILDGELAQEVIEALAAPAREALEVVAQAGGRLPWAAFQRRFGEVREMGAGRRDREQPSRHPTSPAEVLYYRALLGRAFFDTERGPEEFAYVPDELLPLARAREPARRAESPCGRRASSAERGHVRPANDEILDEATTHLAALRSDLALPQDAVLSALLESAGILRQGLPESERVRRFLEMTRPEALHLLVETWKSSESFNELRLVPNLVCEGTWKNEPRTPRAFLLAQLEMIPRDTWWSLASFIADIKERRADFQRAAGDFDSWFIKSIPEGTYLRGFENWDRVEGELIRFLLGGVMHRLALLDLASPADGEPPSAFRLVKPVPNESDAAENGRLHISSQGRISAANRVPRSIRYQLARFCEWDEQGPDEFRYHLSPHALERAAKQGLKVEQLVSLLAKYGDAGIPATIAEALHRWDKAGTEARTETQVLLRVARPELLKRLQDSRAKRFLGQTLGPTTIAIKPGAQGKVVTALAELGILAQDETGEIETQRESDGIQGGDRDGSAKSGANLRRKG